MDAAYVPLEVRVDVPDKAVKLHTLCLFKTPPEVVKQALALDQAKWET